MTNLEAFTWIDKPTVADTFPLATFQILDTPGSYVMGGCVVRDYENVDIQITIYADYSDYTKFDAITNRMKIIMESLGYMIMAGSELTDTDLNKVVKPLRGKMLNV